VAGGIAQSWQGLLARAGTPKAIVEAVAAPLAADPKRPETAAASGRSASSPNPTTPDEFGAFIAAESVKWGEVIQQAEIEAE
jgi:tripartite-type tricarboxylate transporter receptor subunit TctC